MDGYGQLNINEKRIVEWLIIPYKTAAPIQDILYAGSGTLFCIVDGEEVTIQLSHATITVSPDPELNLIYFLEKYVQSDDPMTTEIEPTIPFT